MLRVTRHRQSSSRRRRSQGQALVVVALSSFVLIGMLALSVDAGYLMAKRRSVQSAADAAALAADKAVQRKQASNATATGLAYASANGFANGGDNTVTVNYPPKSGSRTGDNVCVETIVTHKTQKFFVGVIYNGDWQASARSVACTDPTERPYALVALQKDGTGISSSGSSTLIIDNGGALSNNAVDICGTASWIQADGPLDAVNGITICSNTTVETETRNAAAPGIDDPLASVDAPPCGTTAYPDPNIKSSDSIPSPPLHPGIYPTGITINAGSRTITFEPGIYCLGGDLKVNSGSNGTKLVGNGVTFYFYNSAMLNVDGGGNDVQFSHCTDPDIDACVAKIVIFYARTNCSDLTLVGGNDTDVDGIIYAPCSLVHLGGNSGSEITGQIFGGAFDIKGGTGLTIHYEDYVETEVPLVYLVE